MRVIVDFNPTAVTGVVQQNQLPDWLTFALQNLTAQAQGNAASPYQTYSGPRIAGFTQPQQQAFSQVQGGIGNYQPQFQQAGQNYGQVAGGIGDASEFNKYLSPYTSGVVDEIGRLGSRNLIENILPGINTTFTGAGQFGGSRHADFTSNAIRDASRDIAGQQAGALQNSYNSAMNAFQTGQGQRLQAGQAQQALGQATQSAGLTDAAALENIGAQQQQLGQKSLDTAYSDFLEQRDYPKAQVGWLSNILHGLNVPSSSTQTSTAPATTSQLQPSSLSQVAGLGTGALGLAGLFGAFKARGGAVRKYAPGGAVRGIGGMDPRMMRAQRSGAMMHPGGVGGRPGAGGIGMMGSR